MIDATPVIAAFVTFNKGPLHERAQYYRGERSGGQGALVSVFVTPGGRALEPRLDLSNHSPDGFEWGYAGSGPAQLALAILADALGDDARALRLYQRFKSAVVAGLPHTSWRLALADVRALADRLDETCPENARTGGM